jgi:hypothetical protein
MNLETIKALYAVRDEAARQLSDANYDIDTHILLNVRSLAKKIRPIGHDERLTKGAEFDSEKEVFTCWVESYCGEGNWVIDWNGEEQEEDDDRENRKPARILIPARWLDISQEDAIAEHLAQQTEKKALREAREAAKAAWEQQEQEARERSLLEELQAKYKEKS